MNSSTQSNNEKKASVIKKRKRLIKELVVFAMLGSMMFASKLIMEVLPNIHLLGMLTITLTVTYRWKALIPLYIYVMLQGLYAGFNAWWFPYVYVWTVLWALAMLIPRRTPKVIAGIIYPILCSLHGFAFGILYAPGQALMFGYNFEETLAWIATGIAFDITHGIGNIFTGLLVLPFSELLKKLSRKIGIID
jgi:energy-coupling factor transport system substrate-specific component